MFKYSLDAWATPCWKPTLEGSGDEGVRGLVSASGVGRAVLTTPSHSECFFSFRQRVYFHKSYESRIGGKKIIDNFSVFRQAPSSQNQSCAARNDLVSPALPFALPTLMLFIVYQCVFGELRTN